MVVTYECKWDKFKYVVVSVYEAYLHCEVDKVCLEASSCESTSLSEAASIQDSA